MPASSTTIGVLLVAETTCTGNEVTKKLSDALITNADSSHGTSASFDPVFEFSISGRGSVPAGIAVGVLATPDHSDISGGVTICTSLKYTEKNDDYQEWSYGGMNYPGAS